MLKKINCYLLVFLLLLVGCLEPDVSDSAKSQNKDTQVEQKQEEEKNDDKNGQNNDNHENDQNQGEDNQDEEGEEPKNKNLGSIFFFGNSHTFNTVNLETMIKENGYEAKIYHIHTGGKVPLGNDYYFNSIKNMYDMGISLATISLGYENDALYMKNSFEREHLSTLLSIKSTPEIKIFPEDLSWVVVHDGTIPNSLTSTGTFMGLASSLGAKVACYQSWDLKEQSAYAAKKFQLPMIPVGNVIHHPDAKIRGNNNSEYQKDDGHMNDNGKYIYCVLFTHFFTGLSIDEIQGNGNLSGLTEDDKKEMKELMKKIVTDTDKIFKDIKPYYECVKDFDSFKIDKSCKSIEVAKEYSATLQLSQPAVFKLPESKNGKKLKVEVKSNKGNIIPDIWFYDAKDKKLTEQSTNTGYLQNYTFTGKGENWETDGSKILIVTRRGKTAGCGEINKDFDIIPNKDSLINSIIEESVDGTVDFKITVSFVD